jgi:hypothetical protein
LDSYTTAAPGLAERALRVLAIYGFLVAFVVGVLNAIADDPDPDGNAIVAMGLSLIVIWCIGGGTAMYLMRDWFATWARRVNIGWQLRFVLLCVAMALLEEAVTTSLSNAAPWFGAATDAARITVSKNYFEVIANSVVTFIPWFLCWAWLLGRYDFKNLEVVLLFGLTGTLAETVSFGWNNLLGVGMWTCVYGLMVFLPVVTVPRDRNVKPVRWYHCVLAVSLPLVFIFPFVVYVIFAAVRGVARFVRNTAKM